MPGDPLEFVSPGQPYKPSASRDNALIDAARWVRGRRGSGGGETIDAPPRLYFPTAVLNTTGVALNPFDIFALNVAMAWPSELTSEIIVKAVATSSTGGAIPAGMLLGVMQTNANVNDIAEACVCGFTRAKVKIVNSGDKFVTFTGFNPSTGHYSDVKDHFTSTPVNTGIVILDRDPSVAVGGIAGAILSMNQPGGLLPSPTGPGQVPVAQSDGTSIVWQKVPFVG